MADGSSGTAVPAAGGGHRDHLDGLRAVAVYLVVAYHAGIEQLTGGFIGVDLFFVLSGYLVTQVLLRDLAGHDRIRLRRFYARRARRLLPAAAIVLIVTALAYAVAGSPAGVADVRDAIRAASLYVANWFFIERSTDYFGNDVAANPVIHFWSLAVEEQFYLVWPVLFGGLVALLRRAGRWRWWAVRLVIGLAVAASAAAAVVVGRTNLDRAYYGTDTRAYQLLAGALLACTPGVIARARRLPAAPALLPAAGAAALAAVGVLSLSRVPVGPVTRGLAATVVVLGLLVAVEAAGQGWFARVLSLPPIAYLGRISYGTYLWHWPVIVLLGEQVELGSRATLFAAALLATGLASLSYQLVETPVRSWRRLDASPLRVVGVGLAVSLLVGLVAAPRVLDGDRTIALAADGDRAVDGAEEAVDWATAAKDFEEYWICGDPSPAACPIVAGTGPRVLIIGDSHAGTLIPALEQLAEERDLELTAAVYPVCPWLPTIQYGTDERADACRRVKAEWYRTVVPDVDPDLVVLANRTVDDPVDRIPLVDDEDGVLDQTGPGFVAAIEADARPLVDALVADGRTVLVMEPIPIPAAGVDPLACLAEGDGFAPCRFTASEQPTPLEQAYRRLDEASPSVTTVDMDRLVCPFLPICDPVVDGLVVRRDQIHLTGTYVRSLTPAFAAFIDDHDLLG